jgi:hypothetical protein
MKLYGNKERLSYVIEDRKANLKAKLGMMNITGFFFKIRDLIKSSKLLTRQGLI